MNFNRIDHLLFNLNRSILFEFHAKLASDLHQCSLLFVFHSTLHNMNLSEDQFKHTQSRQADYTHSLRSIYPIYSLLASEVYLIRFQLKLIISLFLLHCM